MWWMNGWVSFGLVDGYEVDGNRGLDMRWMDMG